MFDAVPTLRRFMLTARSVEPLATRVIIVRGVTRKPGESRPFKRSLAIETLPFPLDRISRSCASVTPSACTSSYCGIPSDSPYTHSWSRLGRYSSLHHYSTPNRPEYQSASGKLVSSFSFQLLVNTRYQPEPSFLCHSSRSHGSFCTFLCPSIPHTSHTYLVSISSVAWNRGHPEKHQQWKLSDCSVFVG